VLAVSAQVLLAGRGKEPVEFGDGVLTGRGTFQKFYDQNELKTYLETQLQTEAIPAGIGTFYLFKDESTRQQFLAKPHPTRPRGVAYQSGTHQQRRPLKSRQNAKKKRKEAPTRSGNSGSSCVQLFRGALFSNHLCFRVVPATAPVARRDGPRGAG
jgi:DNA phosphorothioation-associated putative methyltransferase